VKRFAEERVLISPNAIDVLRVEAVLEIRRGYVSVVANPCVTVVLSAVRTPFIKLMLLFV